MGEHGGIVAGSTAKSAGKSGYGLAACIRDTCGWTGAGLYVQGSLGAGVSRKAKGLGVMGDCGWGTDGSFPSSEETAP
jgi:hypothetical protein